MPNISVLQLGGLDKKSNDLIRPIEKASDMLNMEYDVQSSLKKRNGYGVFNLQQCDDFIYYSYRDEFLLFINGVPWITVVKKDGTTRILDLPVGTPLLTNVSISSAENQNNIYFTNTDFDTYVMKYDGDTVTRAGLPSPRFSQTSKIDAAPVDANTIPGGFSRFFYSYKDINGNVTYSPYYQAPYLAGALATLTLNTFRTDTDLLENGFYGKYCFKTDAAQTINSANRALLSNKHNYTPGDKFLMDTENLAISITPSTKSFLILEVESVAPNTSITFTAASIGSNAITLKSLGVASYPVDIRCQVWQFQSTLSSANYTLQNRYVLDNSLTKQTIALSAIERTLISSLPLNLSLENIYDSASLKLMPPICKYIGSYGNQIVYMNIQSFFTTYSTINQTAPNQRVDYSNNDLICYSDISTGDGPEGVSGLNLVKIGETWDGEITGGSRCNDSFVIFKNRGVFSIDGALIDGEFQLRKINTNFVGCTSHKSMLQTDDGLFFQGHNGIYFTNAISAKKMTYELDSVFGSGSYLKTRAVRLKKKQKAIFYVEDLSKIIVIDYYYGQVYIWDNIDASCGLVEDASGDVYFAGKTLYSTGLASQSGNTVTGIGTTFTAQMVGGTITYSNGLVTIIDSFTSATSLEAVLPKTVTNESFVLKYGSQIKKFNDTYSDNGLAISAHYQTTWHHAGQPSLNKKFLSIRLFALTQDAFNIAITTEGDWNTTPLTTNTLAFGASDQTKFLMLDMQTKRSLRFKFANNTLNENIAITGYELNFEAYNNVDKN